MLHATDADHLIAVSTIVTRQRGIGRALAIGGAWGVGHGLTILAVGGAIILLGVQISPGLGIIFEFLVGAMLIALGIVNLRDLTKWFAHKLGDRRGIQMHTHVHAHGDFVHRHPHGHGISTHGHNEADTPFSRLDRRLSRASWYTLTRPFLVGTIHGLDGSAAAALLVLATIQDKAWSMVYLLLFGLGTLTGMILATVAFATPFTYTARRLPRASAYIRTGSGLLSVTLGCALIVQSGLAKRLLLASI